MDSKLLIKVTHFKTLGAILHLKGFFGDAIHLASKHGGMEQNSGHNLNQKP